MQNSVHRKAINKRNNIDDAATSAKTEAYTLTSLTLLTTLEDFIEIQTVKGNNTDDPVAATETEASTLNKCGNSAILSFPFLHTPSQKPML